jgi:hypothetical protein
MPSPAVNSKRQCQTLADFLGHVTEIQKMWRKKKAESKGDSRPLWFPSRPARSRVVRRASVRPTARPPGKSPRSAGSLPSPVARLMQCLVNGSDFPAALLPAVLMRGFRFMEVCQMVACSAHVLPAGTMSITSVTKLFPARHTYLIAGYGC